MAPPAAPARPRSAPRRPAQRAHGPRPECGRAPPSRSQPGRAGRCGGRPRPLGAHAPPGPRRPARRWLLAVVAGRPGCCGRWGSGWERGNPGGSCCCSAPQLCSGICALPLPSRVLHPSPRSALPPAAGPGAHVTGACEHAPRGPGPRPHPRPHACARAQGPVRPASAGSRPPERGRGEEPGAEGGGRQVGATPCCFRLRGGFGELCPRAGGGRRGLCAPRKPPSAGVPGPCRAPTRNFHLSTEGPAGGREIAKVIITEA